MTNGVLYTLPALTDYARFLDNLVESRLRAEWRKYSEEEMYGKEIQKLMEDAYAQFRLDGKSHEEALSAIDVAMRKAIPVAVKDFMAELANTPDDSQAAHRPAQERF